MNHLCKCLQLPGCTIFLGRVIRGDGKNGAPKCNPLVRRRNFTKRHKAQALPEPKGVTRNAAFYTQLTFKYLLISYLNSPYTFSSRILVLLTWITSSTHVLPQAPDSQSDKLLSYSSKGVLKSTVVLYSHMPKSLFLYCMFLVISFLGLKIFENSSLCE